MWVFSKRYVEGEGLAAALEEHGIESGVVVYALDTERRRMYICTPRIGRCVRIVARNRTLYMEDASEEEVEEVRREWEKKKRIANKMFKLIAMKRRMEAEVESRIIEEVGEEVWNLLKSLTPEAVLRRARGRY